MAIASCCCLDRRSLALVTSYFRAAVAEYEIAKMPRFLIFFDDCRPPSRSIYSKKDSVPWISACKPSPNRRKEQRDTIENLGREEWAVEQTKKRAPSCNQEIPHHARRLSPTRQVSGTRRKSWAGRHAGHLKRIGSATQEKRKEPPAKEGGQGRDATTLEVFQKRTSKPTFSTHAWNRR